MNSVVDGEMEEVVPEEDQEPVDIDDITPREGIKGVMGDTPIVRFVIFIHGKRRLVSWGEIYRNVEPPEHYEWEHVVDAMNRLIRLDALDEPKKGMFRLNHRMVGKHLHRLCDECAIATREAQGLRPLVPRVKEGMHFRLTDERREFYFNGEDMKDNDDDTHGWLVHEEGPE